MVANVIVKGQLINDSGHVKELNNDLSIKDLVMDKLNFQKKKLN
jgi:hypothetical protein